MKDKIIGISGSPVPNSNTDRLVLHLLKSTGLEYEFVKLSSINIGPCRACKRCVEDNICKVQDDFPALAQKIREAKSLVIGGYTPYGMIDAFTKAFLERLWSMRHLKHLNEQKYVVTVISSLHKPIRDQVFSELAREMFMEGTRHVAELSIEGNVPCLTCGYGDNCEYSGARMIFGEDAKISANYCVDVENQPVWEEAAHIGKLISEHIKGEITSIPSVQVDIQGLLAR
jgi:Multimeric flavodoxin WrbA